MDGPLARELRELEERLRPLEQAGLVESDAGSRQGPVMPPLPYDELLL